MLAGYVQASESEADGPDSTDGHLHIVFLFSSFLLCLKKTNRE